MINYKVCKFNKTLDNFSLDDEVIRHCQNCHKGEKLEISLFAYKLLMAFYKEKTNKDLGKITFNSLNKPLCSEAQISISHSKDVVAVVFSEDCEKKIAIDIEKIKNKKKAVEKLLNLPKNASNEDFYLAWTKHEATCKALGVSILKNTNKEFFGESKIIKIDEQNYAVSIYYN